MQIEQQGLAAASAINVCCLTAQLKGQLISSSLGLPPEEGPGAGCQNVDHAGGAAGAGSGGGNVGAGGSSGVYQNVSACPGGGAYVGNHTHIYPGSGGGGSGGGNGGGVLLMTVAGKLSLQRTGALRADGGAPRANVTDDYYVITM